MSKMEIISIKGSNGYNYKLRKGNKSLYISSLNGYENEMIEIGLYVSKLKVENNDLTFDVSPEEKVYPIIEEFYLNEKEVKEEYDPFNKISITKDSEGTYHFDFTKSGSNVTINVPNFGWINMYRKLQHVHADIKILPCCDSKKVKKLIK